MKSIFIKLGKAMNLLKKDGIVNGSKKTWGYLGVFLSSLWARKTGDILFVTGGVGDSARFRAFNIAEELKIHGFKCSVAMLEDPFLLRYAREFKIFILHKPVYNPKLKSFIEKIKENGGEIIFETDDFTFDPKYFRHIDYLNNINSLERKMYEGGVGKEIIDDPYVKVCTVTTTYLADILRQRNKKVFVVPNKLSGDDLKIAEETKIQKDKSRVTLGYFSGAASHNKDFAVITDALFEIMEKYPDVILFLAGPLEVANKLNKFKGRIKHTPYVSRSKYFENIASVDINLAPLEIGNPFCEAKSELKFFEAGIFSVPLVAAKNRTFGETIEDGVNGFLANSSEEWFEKLERLIKDADLRKRMGEEARRSVLERYTTRNAKNEEYYNYLRGFIK